MSWMTDGWDEREVADLEDEYELLGELGRGASAIVYRARDRFLGILCAIKVVRPHSIGADRDALDRLAQQARTVAGLRHPHIVSVHSVQPLPSGGLSLVMQLVSGRSLKQVIVERGPFPPEEAQGILRDIASALACAHAHGVVHGDVRPENIFLDAESGRAMLGDFGIALSADEASRLTMTGAATSPPAYMAPEQIDGGGADARSDVYSLGLVAWEMLTGRRPWDGESLYQVIIKQRTEELPAIHGLRPGVVPDRLQYVVERMLRKQPSARWASADALLASLDHWVEPDDWAEWLAARAGRAAGTSPARATVYRRRAEDRVETAHTAGEHVSAEHVSGGQAAGEQAAREYAAREQAAREYAAREYAAREYAAREDAARELEAAARSGAFETPAPAGRTRVVVAVAAALVLLGAVGALAWAQRSDLLSGVPLPFVLGDTGVGFLVGGAGVGFLVGGAGVVLLIGGALWWRGRHSQRDAADIPLYSVTLTDELAAPRPVPPSVPPRVVDGVNRPRSR
jgi:tRNA A-37 threonylcarbamoyl transferase component Bud32